MSHNSGALWYSVAIQFDNELSSMGVVAYSCALYCRRQCSGGGQKTLSRMRENSRGIE